MNFQLRNIASIDSLLRDISGCNSTLMQIFKTKSEVAEQVLVQRRHGRSVGLVPTMGNLHKGHIALIETARSNSDFIIASIFVNPLQFGENEDLDSYPRTLNEDMEKLEAAGCDGLFVPSVSEMYGAGLDQETVIHVPQIGDNFCGSSRPGHFDGVSTVVCKLFNIVKPSHAFFGLKDYQQFLVIKKMVRDLALDIEITGVPTVRESSGLAMSSRNQYLDDPQRDSASHIYRALREVAIEIENGSREFAQLENMAKIELERQNIRVDYFSVCHSELLSPASAELRSFAILAAGYLGTARLIDNIRVDL